MEGQLLFLILHIHFSLLVLTAYIRQTMLQLSLVNNDCKTFLLLQYHYINRQVQTLSVNDETTNISSDDSLKGICWCNWHSLVTMWSVSCCNCSVFTAIRSILINGVTNGNTDSIPGSESAMVAQWNTACQTRRQISPSKSVSYYGNRFYGDILTSNNLR